MAYLKILDHSGNKIKAESGFEAARSGRRLGSWVTSTAGINTLIQGSISSLRARARHLRRNDPLASSGVDSLVADLIGTGISPSWTLENQDLKKEIQELWNDFVLEADYNEVYDFYGLQALVSQALVESGEALIWMKPQPLSSDLAVPLQLQVLEGDHLDESYNTLLENGNEVRMSIEFNKRGKRVAYWLWPEHPGESYINFKNIDRIRVPADQICHVYRATRPGQIRGTSWLSSIIVKLYEYNQYDDAELVRKKGAAMFGGFITSPVGSQDATMSFGGTDEVDDSNRSIIALEPGTFPELPPGMNVTFSNPADVGPNCVAWTKEQKRVVAKGMGTTYEKLSGDLSDVNYSSIRAGLVDFQRGCKQKQLQILGFQMCRPVARNFLRMAVLSGALNIQNYASEKRKYWRIKWRPDAWEWVDPLKDAMAAQTIIRNGVKSRSQIISECGGDPGEVNAEIRENNDNIDDNGFVFDSDPRTTAKSGMAQAVENALITGDNQ